MNTPPRFFAAPPPLPAPLPASADKAALRALAAARRAQAHAADAQAGERLAHAFPDALVPPPGAVVSGYAPIRSEIDPGPLLRRLAAAGRRIALPATPPRDRPGPLVFRLWRAGEPLARSPFGVPEPGPDAPAVDPDLVLVPLLAFDRAGRRLGYGQGHYDRTLAALRARRRVLAIGLAFAAQEAERVPTDDRDALLDGIVTEMAYIGPMRTPQ